MSVNSQEYYINVSSTGEFKGDWNRRDSVTCRYYPRRTDGDDTMWGEKTHNTNIIKIVANVLVRVLHLSKVNVETAMCL